MLHVKRSWGGGARSSGAVGPDGARSSGAVGPDRSEAARPGAGHALARSNPTNRSARLCYFT